MSPEPLPQDPDERRKVARLVEDHLANIGFSEYVHYLRSPWSIIWTNLLAGIFRGLGFILGATVIVALLVWLLVDFLGALPWVGDFFRQAGEFVQSIKQASETIKGIGG